MFNNVQWKTIKDFNKSHNTLQIDYLSETQTAAFTIFGGELSSSPGACQRHLSRGCLHPPRCQFVRDNPQWSLPLKFPALMVNLGGPETTSNKKGISFPFVECVRFCYGIFWILERNCNFSVVIHYYKWSKMKYV